jgi:hypothetical protein
LVDFDFFRTGSHPDMGWNRFNTTQILSLLFYYYCTIDFSTIKAQAACGHLARLEQHMAKGQQKKSREARKPKADKGPKQNASQPSLKPGGIKGLENMKNS